MRMKKKNQTIAPTQFLTYFCLLLILITILVTYLLKFTRCCLLRVFFTFCMITLFRTLRAEGLPLARELFSL